jgi:hypothetical protein
VLLLLQICRLFACKVYSQENWRILTSKEIYAIAKKSTITETVRLHRLHWFGHVKRMEENRIPKRVLGMNLETSRLRGRPRNRWQDEVREDGRILVGEEWQEKVYNKEEWKNGMNECMFSRLICQCKRFQVYETLSREDSDSSRLLSTRK